MTKLREISPSEGDETVLFIPSTRAYTSSQREFATAHPRNMRLGAVLTSTPLGKLVYEIENRMGLMTLDDPTEMKMLFVNEGNIFSIMPDGSCALMT